MTWPAVLQERLLALPLIEGVADLVDQSPEHSRSHVS